VSESTFLIQQGADSLEIDKQIALDMKGTELGGVGDKDFRGK